MFRGGSPASGIAAFTGGVASFGAGTSAAPSLTLSDTDTGWYRNAAGHWTWVTTNIAYLNLLAQNMRLHSTMKLVWGSGDALSAVDTGIGRNAAGVVEINNGTLGTLAAIRSNYFQTSTPNTQTGTTYTVAASDSNLIINASATCTLTLPAAAAANAGRTIRVRTIAAFTVVSASSNVVPLVGGSAGTAILLATAGKWADLTSDGTNWQIMAGN